MRRAGIITAATVGARVNPFLAFGSLPRYGELRAGDVDAATEEMLARSRKAEDAAAKVNIKTVSWGTVAAPLARADEEFGRFWGQVEHLHSVMNDAEWRAAYQRNLPKVVAHYAAAGQRADLCAQWGVLTKKRLPPVRRKIAADELLGFELSGVALAAGKQTEFRRNAGRLAKLSAAFQQNILDADNAFILRLRDESALGDMPEDLRAAARADGGGKSPFAITLKAPSYTAFMRHSPARKLREKMYRAHCTRASSFGPRARDNSPVMREIVRLRQKQARLLGRKNYAEMALAKRMAQSPKKVLDFLHTLARRARPFAERELAELRDFSASQLRIKDLRPWDVLFASERLRRARYDFSESEMRPYLPEDKVLSGMFACARELFGAGLRESSPPSPASLWIKGARFFVLRGARGGKGAGYLYLDSYARKSKRGGAWMAEAASRVVENGKTRLPAAHIVCNFRRPAAKRRALLNWGEAETLFHEFGHALHHLLTEAEDYAVSGISGVEWDAVELPSQFMENFLWQRRVVRKITAHEKTGAPMPDALFAKALAARRFQAAMTLMRQLEFALFDWLLHCGGRTPSRALAEARTVAGVLPAPSYNRFPCGFSHIFGGGYAAGYYSYLWAEALAADAFSVFEEAKTAGERRRLGERFRREILAAGGTRPALESFVAFRGRGPSIEPLLGHYGLT